MIALLTSRTPLRRGFFAGMLSALGGCAPIKPMEPDLPCREAGYAIAARTAECTGDGELAQARYEQFRKEFECIEWKGDDPRFDETGGPEAEDLFSCAFTIRNLPCETVKELGGDLSAWLATDPGCSWVVKGGGA